MLALAIAAAARSRTSNASTLAGTMRATRPFSAALGWGSGKGGSQRAGGGDSSRRRNDTGGGGAGQTPRSRPSPTPTPFPRRDAPPPPSEVPRAPSVEPLFLPNSFVSFLRLRPHRALLRDLPPGPRALRRRRAALRRGRRLGRRAGARRRPLPRVRRDVLRCQPVAEDGHQGASSGGRGIDRALPVPRRGGKRGRPRRRRRRRRGRKPRGGRARGGQALRPDQARRRL